jgi:hypothetical protein
MGKVYEVAGDVDGKRHETDMDFTDKRQAEMYAENAKRKGAKNVRVVRPSERKMGLFEKATIKKTKPSSRPKRGKSPKPTKPRVRKPTGKRGRGRR